MLKGTNRSCQEPTCIENISLNAGRSCAVVDYWHRRENIRIHQSMTMEINDRDTSRE